MNVKNLARSDDRHITSHSNKILCSRFINCNHVCMCVSSNIDVYIVCVLSAREGIAPSSSIFLCFISSSKRKQATRVGISNCTHCAAAAATATQRTATKRTWCKQASDELTNHPTEVQLNIWYKEIEQNPMSFSSFVFFFVFFLLLLFELFSISNLYE